jgi:hypothetical protein
MKNITLTVSDEVYVLARVWAARRCTSVSALVRQFLESLDDFYYPVPHFPDGDPQSYPPPPLFL